MCLVPAVAAGDGELMNPLPDTEYPLFPLSTVVFPRGILPMRILEPRYLDMVAHCMKTATGFVICTGRPGGEDGFSTPRRMGTLVEIVDFDRLDDGQLGITVHGHTRVRIATTRRADNGQWWGQAEAAAETSDRPCPEDCEVLKQLAAALLRETGLPHNPGPADYDSASWLSARLTELLPFAPAIKHELLAIDDPEQRLRRLRPLINIRPDQG